MLCGKTSSPRLLKFVQISSFFLFFLYPIVSCYVIHHNVRFENQRLNVIMLNADFILFLFWIRILFICLFIWREDDLVCLFAPFESTILASFLKLSFVLQVVKYYSIKLIYIRPLKIISILEQENISIKIVLA